jgi:hypothetical protein
MSDQPDHYQITQDDVRAARHAGFGDSLAHMDDTQRDRLIGAYLPQDARREENISGFYATVLGPDA